MKGKQKRPALKVKVIHTSASDAAERLSRTFEILLKSATSQAKESPNTGREPPGQAPDEDAERR